MSVARLIAESGVCWPGELIGQPDLLIYCSDGILTGSQVVFSRVLFLFLIGIEDVLSSGPP